MATQGLMYPQEASGLEWNPAAIGARNAMTDWYQQVLAEARKIDPAATLNPQAGNASITVKGQQIPLTNVMKSDQDVYGITPAQMIQQKLGGGLMNLTPQQNQTVFNTELAAMNQTPATADAAYYGSQPPVNGVYSAPHFNVGATEYGVTGGTGALAGKMVQAGPQQFQQTLQGVSGESRPIYNQSFSGYSVTPPAGGGTATDSTLYKPGMPAVGSQDFDSKSWFQENPGATMQDYGKYLTARYPNDPRLNTVLPQDWNQPAPTVASIQRTTEPVRQTAPAEDPSAYFNIATGGATESAQAQPYGSAPMGSTATTAQPSTPSQGFNPRYQGARASQQPSASKGTYYGGTGTYGAGGTSGQGVSTYGGGNTFNQSSAQPTQRPFGYKPISNAPSRSSFGGQ